MLFAFKSVPNNVQKLVESSQVSHFGLCSGGTMIMVNSIDQHWPSIRQRTMTAHQLKTLTYSDP